ncbi:uncharacterized protein PHACADRAFT_119248 [Phanerochaete carnosa HHB-10118-sp]|uniref:Uncharacterized protein n=1 Tax=Phanerochaete carnosa (strain HHB-10118-sp) TaxID=650164 RepID=K5WDG5_PHACS|nr:uncharacterized protein PHACADRAFT_119248 [Phanerochaete carnosa HHB-10118-sp]EKM57069.1 hypothetical protein PHACADRAFT_119248 [Phanerochaete carnosa HHB-10118-sp]
MEKASSIIAALDAGKLPSQQQIDQFIDWLLQSGLTQVEPSPDYGELSQQGSVLVQDLRDVLNAYKQLGDSKNGDDLIQQSLWHLHEADVSNTSTNITGSAPDQASKDASALARALRTIFSILLSTVTQESQSVLHDFASFMRLAIADAADYVSQSAGSAAQTLRQVDEEIEKGDRNEAGLKNKPEEEKFKNKDTREQFEVTMDTIKEAGSETIGAAQVAAATGKDLANRTNDRLQDAFNQICDRAQENQEYHDSINTIFDILSKWLHKSLDTAGDVNTDTSLESFVDDPTPEKHLIKAIRGVREFFERNANGKSLDDFFGALRVCGVDIQQDQQLRQAMDDTLGFMRRCVDERGFVRSGEAQEARGQLKTRWRDITSADTPEGQKWREDFKHLKNEGKEFSVALEGGEDLTRLRKAQAKLASDLEDAFATAASKAADKAAENAGTLNQPIWMWQDIFNAYLPRLLSVIKDIPIPRTEYMDSDVEFILEDLDISRFALLPGHAYIRNITDIDIKAPSAGEAQTAVGSLTRIYAQGIQLALREVSFYFRQKTSSLGPSEFSGILELTLPPQGVDVDVVVRMIPNSPEGLKERELKKSFWDVQRVEVKVSDELDLTIKQSNHQVLASVLKPVITSRFRDTLQTVLAENFRGALEWVNNVAWDVGNRAEVFQDAGLPRGASLVAGFWSELGKLSRGEGGLLKGWKATGTGLIKDEGNARGDAVFAMGAEPQVLSGEKRGPKGNFSESVKERVAAEMDRAKELAGEAKEQIKEGYQQVKSFTQTVKNKAEEEKRKPGWESSAFDVSA